MRGVIGHALNIGLEYMDKIKKYSAIFLLKFSLILLSYSVVNQEFKGIIN